MRTVLLKLFACAIIAAGFGAGPVAFAQNRDKLAHPAMMAPDRTARAKAHTEPMPHGSSMSAMSRASAMHDGAKPQ